MWCNKNALLLVLASLLLFVSSLQMHDMKNSIIGSSCKKGTNGSCQNSHISTDSCPPGYYCPEGITVPIACPAGTYSWTTGATSATACTPCPENTFSPNPASTVCLPCGPHSTATAGSAECRCTATNRMFHISDGSCRCKAGHELTRFALAAEGRIRMKSEDSYGFAAISRGLQAIRSYISPEESLPHVVRDVSEAEVEKYIATLSESELAGFDCKPIAMDKCLSTQIRAANGDCVDRAGRHCAVMCGTATSIDEVTSAAQHGHFFDLNSGLCQCKNSVAAATKTCNANCQALLPSITLTTRNKESILEIAFSSPSLPPKTFSIPTAAIPMLNDISCQPVGTHNLRDSRPLTCQVQVAATGMAAPGVSAVYGLPSLLRDVLLASHPDAKAYLDTLPMDNATKTVPAISPAVFCVPQGASFLFQTSPAALSFPVYSSHSLLNTNPSFDFAPFANLPKQHGVLYSPINNGTLSDLYVVPQGTSLPSSSLFGYTFSVAGTYVFHDSAFPANPSIIRVLPVGQRCPSFISDPLASFSSASVSSAPHAALATKAVTAGPITVSSVSSLGVGIAASGIVASPNWGLLGILVLIFIGVFLMCCLFLIYVQKSGWSTQKATAPEYRKEAIDDNLDVWTFSTKGTVMNMESRSNGSQKLEMDKEDLLIEALARIQSNNQGASADVAHKLKLKYMHTPHDPELNEDEKRVMYELTNNADFEDVDFHSLYKTLEATNSRMKSYFSRQSELLHVFYNKTETDIEHLKSLLSVKMQVQIQKTGEGFAEAVDRLVSGELLARQAFHELYTRRESRIKMLLEEIRARIANITIDCNIFPIMQLLKELHDVIKQAEQRLLQERVRRKTFASHVEIVGKDIVEILLKQDKLEVEAQDDYWHALLYFAGQVKEVRHTMQARESTHLIEMEALTNEEDRRIEQMQYHRAMVELVRIIQVELMNLEERLGNGIMLALVERNDEAYDIWVYIQSTLLQKRLASLRNPTEGRIFRGINPDLAKVLTGVMGMLRSGIKVNPKTGCYVPKAPFDPADPFQSITDPGDVYREWYEQQLANAVEQIRQEADDLRREQEEAEMARKRADEEARAAYERQLQEEIEREKEAMRNAVVDVNVDNMLQDMVSETVNEDVQAVADDLQKDQRELLATLQRKRAEIEENDDISDEEKAKLLKIWDDKIQMMEEMLKDEALGLLTYLQSQKQDEEPVEEAVAEDQDTAPSLRELELMNELQQVKSQLDALNSTLNSVPVEDDDEISAAEKLLSKKEKEMASFEKANADKLRELDELIRQRKQARLMGEMGDLADDDLDGLELDEEYRALQLARLAHAEELESAKEKLMRKRNEVQQRQEAKRKAIEEAERREAALKKELMEQDDEEEDDGNVDESVLLERKRRFEETQKMRRDAELSRLEEEQRRAIAAASDASEAKRLVKEFEMNKLNLLKKLNQEEQGQRSRLDEALRKRQEARQRKLAAQNETPQQRAEKKKQALAAIAKHEQDVQKGVEETEEEAEAVRRAQEIIFEDDGIDENELRKLSDAERAAYQASKEAYEKEKEARIQKRKDARRKRLESEQRKEAEREKAKELERLQRIHHDMELDLIEESLLQELEVETKNIVEEALGLAGIEVFNVFAAYARKLQVESRIERVKQEMDDAKEANEERTMEEAQKLLTQAAKEREDLQQQMEAEQNRQAKILQDRLQARRNQNASKIKEDRERRKRDEAQKLENAQRQAELNAQLQMIKNIVGMVDPKEQQREARRIIEAQLHDKHNKEKVGLLGTQSAERKMLWKEKMLENDDTSPEEVQALVSATYDADHNRQLRELEEKHLNDIKSLYTMLFPNADVSGPEWSVDSGKEMLQELAKKKQEMLEEERRRKEEEFERKKKELEEKERKLEEENRRKLEELQSKKAADDAEYQQLLADHDEKLLKNHKMLLARKQQLLDAELQNANQQDQEMRQRLAAQQKEEMARYEAALKEEYQRQKQAMVKRLQLRRQLQQQRKNDEDRKRREEEKKKKRMEEKLKAREKLEKMQAPKEKMPEVNTLSISITPPASDPTPVPAAASTATNIGMKRGQARAEAAASPSATQPSASLLAEEVQQKALMMEQQAKKDEEDRKAKEQMTEKLEAIKNMVVELDKLKREQNHSVYIDEKDKLIKPLRQVQLDASLGPISQLKLEPEPKSISTMAPKEFVLYRFGVNLLKLLAEQKLFELPIERRRAEGAFANIPTFLIASGLPPSPYTNITFPNSYWYDSVDNRLWIRYERLNEPGEFVLVFLHALAHISTNKDGESFHDHDHAFVKQFYSYMRLVCSDMYFSRSNKALVAIGERVATPDVVSPAISTSPSQDGMITDINDVLLEEIDLFDNDNNCSLLPNKFTPRIPKLESFKLETVDLTSTDTADMIDDLIDIHVTAVDSNNHITNSSTAAANKTFGAVLSSSHGMSYFSTSQLLQRLSQYDAFASSTRLRQFLVNVEKKHAGYERTREKLGRDRYRSQDAAVQRVAARENEDKLVREQEDQVPVSVMEDVCDELNRQLISVVDQSFECSAKIQQLERKNKDAGVSLRVRAQLSDELEAEKGILSRLEREKAVLIQRIKHLETKDIPNRTDQKLGAFDIAVVTNKLEKEKQRADDANNGLNGDDHMELVL